MKESENRAFEIAREYKKIEPEVSCAGAILSKTDTAVSLSTVYQNYF